MLKKTISYTDYNGLERTEDFYFNLSKAELLDMELAYDGGFTQYLESIINAKDQKTIISVFKQVIMSSYGVKSADGRRFIKNQEVLDEFVQSEAFSNLYMELVSNEDVAAEFIKGIVPKDLNGDKTDDNKVVPLA